MATNPYINKVEFDGDTLMDLTSDTVSPSDVLLGETFHDRSGAPQTGTLDPYVVGDTAETDIQDTDYFPFYDTSAKAKRKTLWSNIKAKLKAYFDEIYSTFSGSYNDLSDKPTIPAAQIQSDWNQTSTTAKDFIKNKPTIPAAQIQSDWNQTTTTAKDYIKNKPTIYKKGVYYGTCTSQAANQTKAVTIAAAQGFTLEAGATIYVKFDANNTYTATAAAPVKLNVNNTGAKNVYYGGSSAPTGTNTTVFGRANYINQYIYDGTYWVWQGSSADNNTTYSAMSASELTTGTATTARSVRADYLKSGINSLIDTKINALDVTGETGIAASKTVQAWSETDGKVSLTTQDIEITKSQVSDFPSIDDTPTSGSSNLVKSGGVYSKMVHEITRTVSSAAANSQIRIPATGTDSRISTANTCIVKPICQTKSDGTPYKFKSCVVSAGYATITVSEALSNVTIGVEVVNI